VPDEAELVETGAGLVPQSEGWFVLNVRDAAWLTNEKFGSATVFETTGRVVREHPELHPQQFDDLGINLRVLSPGQPNCMYHAESNQEDFLVLAGECHLLVDGTERQLRAWDFVHCPANVEHVFVGAGDGPCVLLMVGRRDMEETIVYPRSELALVHGAGVEQETPSPAEAYASFPHYRDGRPASWDELPWSTSS
jgi:uncharacterized cupin superfamily protein